MKTRFLLPVLFTCALTLNAQKAPPSTQTQLLWFGYFNTIQFNGKWGFNTDIQFRAKEWYKTPSQLLFRTGVFYKLTDKISVTIGGAHFRYFQSDGITRGEWRPWEEIFITDKIGRVALSHRFRIEQRFHQVVRNNETIDDYQYNNRFRYRLEVRIPLTKKQEKLQLVAGNEIMINAGQNISGNYFDQDRLYAGLRLQLNQKISVQFQYMHIWQQLSNSTSINNSEVLRLNIYHNISL